LLLAQSTHIYSSVSFPSILLRRIPFNLEEAQRIIYDHLFISSEHKTKFFQFIEIAFSYTQFFSNILRQFSREFGPSSQLQQCRFMQIRNFINKIKTFLLCYYFSNHLEVNNRKCPKSINNTLTKSKLDENNSKYNYL